MGFFPTRHVSVGDDDLSYVVIAEKFDGPPRAVLSFRSTASSDVRAAISVHSTLGRAASRTVIVSVLR